MNAMGAATISDLFLPIFGGIPTEARQTWIDTFAHISNEDIEAAARWIIAHRTRSGKVVPGELWHALQEIGVTPERHYESKEFRENPTVRAINGHYRAMQDLPGITLSQWLKDEGLPSFRAAMEKYGDRPSSAEQLLALVEPKEEAPF